MLGQVLIEGQEAALGIEPGVCLQLLVVGLKALDDAADAKLVVALQITIFRVKGAPLSRINAAIDM